jgi:hypothetical protein
MLKEAGVLMLPQIKEPDMPVIQKQLAKEVCPALDSLCATPAMQAAKHYSPTVADMCDSSSLSIAVDGSAEPVSLRQHCAAYQGNVVGNLLLLQMILYMLGLYKQPVGSQQIALLKTDLDFTTDALTSMGLDAGIDHIQSALDRVYQDPEVSRLANSGKQPSRETRVGKFAQTLFTHHKQHLPKQEPARSRGRGR